MTYKRDGGQGGAHSRGGGRVAKWQAGSAEAYEETVGKKTGANQLCKKVGLHLELKPKSRGPPLTITLLFHSRGQLQTRVPNGRCVRTLHTDWVAMQKKDLASSNVVAALSCPQSHCPSERKYM
jgi:hypothetical protein